jgi:hypothetical protein
MGGNFMRSANSGAFVGGKNAHRKAGMSAGQILAVKGDLVPPDFLPYMVVESKSYADFQYHQMFTAPVPLLDNWIAQTLDCVDEHDHWFVCFKTNRKPWLVVFDADNSDKFLLKQHSIYYTKNGMKCVATGLHDFLSGNVEAIKALCGPRENS